MKPDLFLSWLPGGYEMLMILFVVLLVFGAKKLPELARGIGRSLGEFKKARHDFEIMEYLEAGIALLGTEVK
jgi:sec-independent protein translocase protein TatA